MYLYAIVYHFWFGVCRFVTSHPPEESDDVATAAAFSLSVFVYRMKARDELENCNLDTF